MVSPPISAAAPLTSGHLRQPVTDPLSGFTIQQLADRVIRGEFGNGQARRTALGDRYNAVQQLVNANFAAQQATPPVTQPSAVTSTQAPTRGDNAQPKSSPERTYMPSSAIGGGGHNGGGAEGHAYTPTSPTEDVWNPYFYMSPNYDTGDKTDYVADMSKYSYEGQDGRENAIKNRFTLDRDKKAYPDNFYNEYIYGVYSAGRPYNYDAEKHKRPYNYDAFKNVKVNYTNYR